MESNRFKLILALLLALFAGRLVMHSATGFWYDDAFITFRYAENLAEGNGFVYNPDEKVQGSSTPLFTALLAGVALLFGSDSIPEASRILSLIADAGSLILLLWVVRLHAKGGELFVGIFFALYPKVILISSSGMETSLVILLMLISFYGFVSNKIDLSLVSLALLLVLRLDSALWVAIILAAILVQKKKLPLAGTLIGGGIVASWFLFATIYFGTPIPHTVIAKASSWQHLYPLFDPLRVLLGYLPFQGLMNWPPLIQILILLVLSIPFLFGFLLLLRRQSPLLVFPVFFLLYTFAYCFGRVLMADWYYMPGYLACAVTLAPVWVWIEEKLSRGGTRRTAMVVARVVLVVLFLGLATSGVYRWSFNPGKVFQTEHVRIAEWLRDNAPRDADVLLEPIGYVGWASELYVHDIVGMVSPGVLDYRTRYGGSDIWFLSYLRDVRPAYVVLQDREIAENRLFLGHGELLFQNEDARVWFLSRYTPVSEHPDPGGSPWPHMVLFARMSTAAQH